jgi:hypothetical protein
VSSPPSTPPSTLRVLLDNPRVPRRVPHRVLSENSWITLELPAECPSEYPIGRTFRVPLRGPVGSTLEYPQEYLEYPREYPRLPLGSTLEYPCEYRCSLGLFESVTTDVAGTRHKWIIECVKRPIRQRVTTLSAP